MSLKLAKLLYEIFANSYLFGLTKLNKAKSDITRSLMALRDKFAEESLETKEMLEIYARYSQGKASKEEMKIANEQFRDLIRALGLSAFIVLPFAPLTIPLIVKISQKLGIEILPSSFRRPANKDGHK